MPELSILGSVIKTAYEQQADTNAFQDAEKSKLANLSAVAESGDYGDLLGKPAVIAEGATAAEAREAIGALAESEKGAPGGVATLDGSGVVPLEQVNVSGLTYLGVWDASTNDPELLDGAGSVGDFYKTSVEGTQNFGNGPFTFGVGDWVIFAAGTWQRVGVHEAVSSVNGQTGPVVLDAEAVGALPSNYTPPAPSWGEVTSKPDFNALYAPKLQGSISAPIPAVYASLSAAQSIPNSTVEEINWTGIIYDEFSMLSEGNFIVPVWATHARVTVGFLFAENGTGYRYGGVRLNGSADYGDRSNAIVGSFTNLVFPTPIFSVSGGDEISSAAWQNSGGSLDISTVDDVGTWIQIELYTSN